MAMSGNEVCAVQASMWRMHDRHCCEAHLPSLSSLFDNLGNQDQHSVRDRFDYGCQTAAAQQ